MLSLQEQINILEDALIDIEPSAGSDTTEELCQFLCKMATCYNELAVKKLRDGDSESALHSLEKAKALLDNPNVPSTRRWLLQAETSTNISYVYKCLGSPITALSYLRKALIAETRLRKSGLYIGDHDAVSTLLSICAVQSELGRHSDAARSARIALSQLRLKSKLDDTRSPAAWYNLAVEYEHLRDRGKARHAFSRALDHARSILGPDHPLTVTVKLALEEYN